MYESLTKSIEEACTKNHATKYSHVECLDKIQSSRSTFMYLLSTCKALKIDKYLIQEAKDNNYIGTLKLQSDNEHQQEFGRHISCVMEGLEESLREYSGSNRDYLQASLDLLKETPTKFQCRKEKASFGAFDDEPFHVPQGFDQENLRLFLYEDYAPNKKHSCFEEPLEYDPPRIDPGKDNYPLDNLTLEHITHHNANHRNAAVWMPLRDKVYNAKGIYISLSPIIRKKCREIEGLFGGDRYAKVRRHIHSSSSFLLVLAECKSVKVGSKTLEKAKQENFIGSLKKETIKEKEDDFIVQIGQAIEGLQERLTNYPKSNDYDYDYVGHYLRTAVCSYTKIAAHHSVTRQKPLLLGDQNVVPFDAPEWFNPQTLRSFLNNETAFDTTLDPPEQEDWTHLRKPDVGDANAAFALYVRSWLNTSEPFDTEIEGEVAWSVADVDVIKNDQPTEAQIKMIESRSQRKYFNSKKRMRKRRRQLAHSLSNGENPEFYFQHVESWIQRLEESANDFAALVSNPEAVIKRNSDLSFMDPLPIPPELTAAQKTKIKQRREKIAKYFDSNPRRTKHHRLKVENQDYSEHAQIWAEYLEENAKALAKLCNEQ